jgi:hypothetical protein
MAKRIDDAGEYLIESDSSKALLYNVFCYTNNLAFCDEEYKSFEDTIIIAYRHSNHPIIVTRLYLLADYQQNAVIHLNDLGHQMDYASISFKDLTIPSKPKLIPYFRIIFKSSNF